MLDFSNLTQEQQDFFNEMWENHLRESEQNGDSIKAFNAYVEQRRKREESQEQAAQHLKSLMK